jgi:hypothetical protein
MTDLHPELLRMLIITVIAFIAAGGLGFITVQICDKLFN